MSSNLDDTVLPPKRRARKSAASDGDTVLPAQLSTVSKSDNPGDVIDNRYTVIREIGRGGMGVVYEVEDSLLGGRFAIKRLLPELSSRTDLIEVFKREGANAMRFTSESKRFVTMRHVGADSTGLYLVMDLISASTLRSVIESNAKARLPLGQIVSLLLDFATALSELHGLGFVHRDLKPENVFIVAADSTLRVRLVDFGLCKEDIGATQTSIRGAGTSGYASPEQRKGLPTTATTDVFAFGVIAFELLTSELPGIGDSVTDYNDEVPSELVDIVMQCLLTRSEKRPQDGTQLLSALEKAAPSISPKVPVIVSNVESKATDAVPKTELENGLVSKPRAMRRTRQAKNTSATERHESLVLQQPVSGTSSPKPRPKGKSESIKDILRQTANVSEGESSEKQSAIPTDGNPMTIAVSPHDHELATSSLKNYKLDTNWVEKFPRLHEYIECMTDIPGGEFMMGSPDNVSRISSGFYASYVEWFTVVSDRDDLLRYSRPMHKVKLSPFSIGKTPVTVGLWKEYCVATGTQMPSEPSFGWNDDHPLVNVSWNDANGNFDNDGVFAQSHFLEWIKQTTGLNLSLPTEAQWEYAARAGDTSTWFGDHMNIAGLYDLCDGKGIRGTVSLVDGPGIETYYDLSSAYSRANRWGLVDMIGNVWELCRDCFGPYPGTITTNVVHKSVQVNSGGVLGLFGKKETKSVPTTIHVSSAPPLTVDPFRPVAPQTGDNDEEDHPSFNVRDCVVRGGSWCETIRLNYEGQDFGGEPSVVFAYPFRAGCSISERNHSLGFRLVSATVSPWATAMELLEKEMD